MAPYKSEAQRKKFHALLKEGKISKKVVAEFDAATVGHRLPERAEWPSHSGKIKKVRKVK